MLTFLTMGVHYVNMESISSWKFLVTLRALLSLTIPIVFIKLILLCKHIITMKRLVKVDGMLLLALKTVMMMMM